MEVGDEQQEEDGEYHCGVCGQLYEESTEEEELWIACDVCFNWHHAMCVEIDDIPEEFVCFFFVSEVTCVLAFSVSNSVLYKLKLYNVMRIILIIIVQVHVHDMCIVGRDDRSSILPIPTETK